MLPLLLFLLQLPLELNDLVDSPGGLVAFYFSLPLLGFLRPSALLEPAVLAFPTPPEKKVWLGRRRCRLSLAYGVPTHVCILPGRGRVA
jgi:hypothetical protein